MIKDVKFLKLIMLINHITYNCSMSIVYMNSDIFTYYILILNEINSTSSTIH